MSTLILVHNFFDRLLSYEKKTLKRFISLHENESTNKALELFNMLESAKTINEEQFIKVIYEEVNASTKESFRKLVERFREKMYESNGLDINIYNKKFASPFYAGIMEVKKLVPLVYHVISRGVPIDEINRLLNRGIYLSNKFEFYDENVIFLKLKLQLLGYHTGFKKQAKIFEEIEYAEEKRKVLFQSRTLYYHYICDLQFKSSDDLRIRDDIKKASEEVRVIYDKFNLWNIYYDWACLNLQVCHFELNYSGAVVLLDELIETCFKVPALYQFHKIADCYYNLCHCLTYLFKFEDASEKLLKAQEFSPVNVSTQNYYKQARVILLIYMTKYNDAKELLNNILSSGPSGNAPQEFSRRNYLYSILHFLTGDYKQSFRLLQETREIEDDKEGWNIGIRLLQIFLTLETEKVDLADQRIESLRKHIERTAKMKSVRKRDVIIFRILTHLSRSGFDFKDIWDERKKDFTLLRSDDPDYRWIPRSHELIIFDQWFESKVKGETYIPVFPAPVH